MIQWSGEAYEHKRASSCSQNHCHLIGKPLNLCSCFPSGRSIPICHYRWVWLGSDQVSWENPMLPGLSWRGLEAGRKLRHSLLLSGHLGASSPPLSAWLFSHPYLSQGFGAPWHLCWGLIPSLGYSLQLSRSSLPSFPLFLSPSGGPSSEASGP